MGAQVLLEHLMEQQYASPQSSVAAPPLVLLASFIVAVIVVVVVTTPWSRAEKLLSKLPSPPLRLPVVGHLHLIGPLPHHSLRDLARKHGPDVLLLRLGAVPTVVVSSARAARAVLRTHDHVFASRPRSAVGDILFHGRTNVAFAPYGDYWRQARKVVSTRLLAASKVRAGAAAREREVRLVLAKVRRAAAARAAVDVSEVLSYFANDVICQAVVGRLPREEGRNQMFRDLLETNAKLLGGFNLDDYFPSLGRWLVGLVSGKALKQKKRWDDLLDDLIERHRRREAAVTTTVSSAGGGEEDEEEDFIDVLLAFQQEYGLTTDNIKAILIDMFEAGTDTTYISLDYAMAELMQKPETMAKLQAEVRRSRTNKTKGTRKQEQDDEHEHELELVSEEEMSSMPYLMAVMKESMRLHAPGALLIPHFSMAEAEVEGHSIPAGTRVILNAWAMGRDAACWESAEEFVPERFLEGGTDAGSDFTGNDFRFLPFGSGRRICPGISFTVATFQAILANLVYHFDWELPPGATAVDMTESYGLDVHRKESLLLVPSLHKHVAAA